MQSNNFLSKSDFESLPRVQTALNLTNLRFSESNTIHVAMVNSKVLDPTQGTLIAQYGSGIRGCSIKMHGKWIPGIGHPEWGPDGNVGNIFNGANKWCVLLKVVAGIDQQVVAVIPWSVAQGGIIQIGNFGFPTAIIAYMNDDMYSDNSNKADDPMTADVSFF